MAAPTSQISKNLPGFFADLIRLEKTGNYEKALRIVDKILSEEPNDKDAVHCRIVCLVQIGNFDEALKIISKSSLKTSFSFEKAYCQYRLNRSDEALSTLGDIKNPDQRSKELHAQVLYRLERYDECYEVYKDVIKNSTDDYEEERQTNLSAVIASLQSTKVEDVEYPIEEEETYEITYNAACYELHRGRLQDALAKLKQAEVRCRSMCEEEEYPEEETEAELAIIRVQKAYVLQLLGKPGEAIQIYNQVNKSKPSDPAINAVIANNIVTVNKDQNVFESKKKMRVATADSLRHKLTVPQRQLISVNECLFALATNQVDACKKAVRVLSDRFPAARDQAVLIEAALYVKQKQLTKAIDILKAQVQRENAGLAVTLALAQLHLQAGGAAGVGAACDLLQDLAAAHQYPPGLVASLVSLHLGAEGGPSRAARLLADAVAWHRDHSEGGGGSSSPTLVALSKACAEAYLGTPGQEKEAVPLLEWVRRQAPGDQHVLAKLISAYSRVDPAKAQALGAHLPSAEKLAQAIDVDSLETNNIATVAKYGKKSDKGTRQHPPGSDSPAARSKPTPATSTDGLLEAQRATKRRKKRKGPLPKSYDPNVDPDPERWLPRWERSTVHGRKKRGGGGRRKEDVGKGTQGGLDSLAADKLDASKTTPTAAAASPQTTPASSKGAKGAPKGGKKKGKGKGQRW